MLLAIIAEARHSMARLGRALPFARSRSLFLLGFLVWIAPQMAQAQHCGRIGYVLSLETESLSWERNTETDDSALSREAARIRKTGCEGPLCRSRTPQPLTPDRGSDSISIPLPWTCTGLASASLSPNSICRVGFDPFRYLDDPIIEPLAKPPRIG